VYRDHTALVLATDLGGTHVRSDAHQLAKGNAVHPQRFQGARILTGVLWEPDHHRHLAIKVHVLRGKLAAHARFHRPGHPIARHANRRIADLFIQHREFPVLRLCRPQPCLRFCHS
jgi:hypothetical protein